MTTHPTDTPLGTATPRTVAAKQAMRDRIADALAKNADFDFQVVSEEFAATLETELNAAKDQHAHLMKSHNEMSDFLNKIIGERGLVIDDLRALLRQKDEALRELTERATTFTVGCNCQPASADDMLSAALEKASIALTPKSPNP